MKNDVPPTDPWELESQVYYSQNREDLILLSFFPDVEQGFYVDVGAFHPDYDSVTKLFYLKGWKGINIEPQAKQYRLFEQKRKRDINLNVGVSDKKGKLTLRSYDNGGLSTFSTEVKDEYETQTYEGTRDFTEVEVAVRPLRDILTEYKLPRIHFMKVDVEGFEYEVLAGNDWRHFRPEVICIESNHIKHNWRPLLKEVGYESVFNDGLNTYYVDKQTDRKRMFNFVQDVVVDRGGGLRADHYERMRELYGYGIEQAHRLALMEQRFVAADKKAQTYEQQLVSITATTKRLAKLLSRNIKARALRGNS